MKILVLVPLAMMISFSAKKTESYFNVNDIKKNYVKTKPGLYVSKYEVSNADYRRFLSDLAISNQTDLYQRCLPDTLCWKDKVKYSEPLTAHYFRHPSFDDYPVVGISFEAANEYCSWLTKKYNQDPRRKFDKVVFKLLSREEWVYAANKGDTAKQYTWGSGFMQNNRKQDLCNYKHTQFIYDTLTQKYREVAPVAADNREVITASISAYYPSSCGVYNMCGNVAEMGEEKGIAYGGSYDDPAYSVRIASEKTYTKPQADIGFRVAMKVTEPRP